VDEFLDGTNLQIDRCVTRLDVARGKKQVWRPHFRTWGLPEANVLYWRMYVWHCWNILETRSILASREWFGLRVIAPPLPPRYAPADWTIMQRVKSYRRIRLQKTSRCVTMMQWTCSISSINHNLRNYAVVQLLTLYTWTTQRSIWITVRGVTRLDGARGKKEVWRPHVRTWGLSEANVLHWSTLTLLGLFGALMVIRCKGNCAPWPPLLRPWLLRSATRLNKSWYTTLTTGIREPGL